MTAFMLTMKFTATALVLCMHSVSSHTFLTYPDAYNRKFQLRTCKGNECKQACPSIPKRGMAGMRNTPDSPAASWERGQTVSIKWARNNHIHGFIRFSIVPLHRTMSRKTHDELALFYGCFTQGRYSCSGDECGADIRGYAYHMNFTIPSILPDGMYIFGLVWYGGIHMPLSKGTFFSDYWSCSYIRIHGGKQVGGSHQPFFDPGDNDFAEQNGGKCLTAIDAPGVCPNLACTGPAFAGVPRPFRHGRVPNTISHSEFVAFLNSTSQ